jgi:hypothetical protein
VFISDMDVLLVAHGCAGSEWREQFDGSATRRGMGMMMWRVMTVVESAVYERCMRQWMRCRAAWGYGVLLTVTTVRRSVPALSLVMTRVV